MNNISSDTYHEQLRSCMDEFVHLIYKVSRNFPKEELYGVTSQIRRSSLSIILNYIEGYARFKTKIHKNFLEIAYGSLHESKYLLEFSFNENYLDQAEFKKAHELADRIGAMLWGILSKLEN